MLPRTLEGLSISSMPESYSFTRLAALDDPSSTASFEEPCQDTKAEESSYIDLERLHTLQHYFRHIDVDTGELQMAILPYLNMYWAKNSQALITEIKSFVDKFSPQVYKACIEAIKYYVNGRDFVASGRFETKWSFFGGFKYIGATSALTELNQALDNLLSVISSKKTDWNCVLGHFYSFLSATANYLMEHPKSALVLMLYGEAIISLATAGKISKHQNELTCGIRKSDLERIFLSPKEAINPDRFLEVSKIDNYSPRFLVQNNFIFHRHSFENFIEIFTSYLMQFKGNIFEETQQYVSYFLYTYNISHILPHYALQQASEDILLIKLHIENDGYTLVLKTDFKKQRITIESINGPYVTGNGWAKRYGFEFSEIPDQEAEEAERDIKKDFLQVDNIGKLYLQSETLTEVNGKVFGICVSSAKNLDIQIIQKIKNLAQSGATIHLVYPVKSIVFITSKEAKVGNGKIIFYPTPKNFYIENFRLTFDSLPKLDGLIDCGITHGADGHTEMYAKIRGEKYIPLNFFYQNPTPKIQPFPILSRASKAHQFFAKILRDLIAVAVLNDSKDAPIYETLINKNIIVYSSECWFVGGEERYNVLYLAYLMVRNRLNIYLLFPDITLTGEYLSPINFGKGMLYFVPINAEDSRLFPADIFQKSISKAIDGLRKNINIDVMVIAHLNKEKNPVNYIASKGIPTFIMYHTGVQKLFGRIGNIAQAKFYQETIFSNSKSIIGVVSREVEKVINVKNKEDGFTNRAFYCGPLVDFNLFNRNVLDPIRLNELKDIYHLTSQTIVLIMPNRFTPNKGNLEGLTAACNVLQMLGKDFRIFIIGDSMSFPEYEKKISKFITKYRLHDKVIIIKYLEQKDLMYYYSMANLGLLITKAEGKGLVHIEGRAMQVPWVLSNVDGIVDDTVKVSAEGEITGSVFSVEVLNGKVEYLNTAEIISNCEKVLLDIFSRSDWKEFLIKAGKNGEKFVKEEYSVSKTIARHEYVLDILANNKTLSEVEEKGLSQPEETQRKSYAATVGTGIMLFALGFGIFAYRKQSTSHGRLSASEAEMTSPRKACVDEQSGRCITPSSQTETMREQRSASAAVEVEVRGNTGG